MKKIATIMALLGTVLTGCEQKPTEKEKLEARNLQLRNEVIQEEMKMNEEVRQSIASTRQAVSDAIGKTKEAYAARTSSIGEAEEVGGNSGVSSIRAEMRHGAVGGYVLQVWNTTDKVIKCEATLNNPKLNKTPKYKFALQPQSVKPQEIGAGQFGGRRILDDPPCTVTVRIIGTNEEHVYQP